MICERHDEIIDKLDDHSIRIRKLELTDATLLANFNSLTQSIKEVVWWLKLGIVSIMSISIGFIVWYIQSL